ncbi:uncharacterized protein LOC142330268 [Lycorma delicatula]|uniref:uncharacterized protein LOC142330268 n=1 Tax=Lycorma delicatula TaxID=130591 RepID=UPI003F50FDB7
MAKTILILFVFYCCLNLVKCLFVELSNDAPVVLGATVNFRAQLLDSYGQNVSPDSYFTFHWIDNAMPPHKGQTAGYIASSNWNASYSKPGIYEVEVTVYLSNLYRKKLIASARQFFNISLMLNGGMIIEQNNSTVELSRPFVSSASVVEHNIILSEPDARYLNTSATSVLTYWFVDCVYYGVTSNMSFSMNYTGQVGQEKAIEAFVIASYVEPTLPPTTTTPIPTTIPVPTSSTSTPITVTTQISPNSTTSVPATQSTPVKATTVATNQTSTIPATILKTDDNKSNSTNSSTTDDHQQFIPNLLKNVTLVPGKNYSNDRNFPYICSVNSSIIPPGGDETYGYFKRKIQIRDPVQNVSFIGTNWLKQGDMLNLGVSCNGSGPFSKCVQMYPGEYHVIGNETCDNERFLSECKFSIVHYFKKAETYTLVIIVSNEVSKTITPVAVNIYEVTKHPQLSVIIVPVACSAVAVILIVFGIAYYIQSRNRYTVEVADFDFAQTTDMEYKTFSERLKEAMSNAVNRTQDYVEEGNVWSPSRKYGSMQ